MKAGYVGVNKIETAPCRCCSEPSIRALVQADDLCLRCYEQPDKPHFIDLQDGQGIRNHECTWRAR